jgi:metal-responsive CopG/Arc/MetJ family transcriptional regulator
MAVEQQKVTVTLPKGLIDRLNETVPSRKRSLFITEAIAEHLDLIEQVSALEESVGAWSLENHPELKDGKSIDKWLKESRQNWR